MVIEGSRGTGEWREWDEIGGDEVVGSQMTQISKHPGKLGRGKVISVISVRVGDGDDTEDFDAEVGGRYYRLRVNIKSTQGACGGGGWGGGG